MFAESPVNQPPKNWASSFFPIWIGQAFSLFGSQLVQFALIWWLTSTTGSATVLATATLVGLLPQVFLMPIAGTFVDRWNRRVTMIVADGLVAMATLTLVALFWMGNVQVWQVYLLMFVRAAAGSFHWPAMQASTSLMVPEKHLSRVQGLNQMLNGGLNIIAAPLGAVLLAVFPMQGVLLIDIGTALLAILPLFFVTVPQPARSSTNAAPGEKPSALQDFRAGLRYVMSWPGLMIIGIMATLINLLLTPAYALMPILVTKHFAGGAMQFAWMESVFGIGVILGGLILSVWGGFRRRIYTSMLGLVGMGIGSLLIGFVPASAFSLAVAGAFLMGIASPITNGPLFAALQAVVAPDMQGRVFTLVGSVAAAMTPLGLIVAGPVADAVGVQAWFIIGGLVTVAMAFAGLLIPAVVNFEKGAAAELSQPAAEIALAEGD
jgi:DHA3 family macrolide efflux protein-like MFS transporter